MAGIQNREESAIATFGEVPFGRIPKSTWALLAYHLAHRLSGCEPEGMSHEGALKILAEEAAALHSNAIITDSQARACKKNLGGSAES